jgi:M6 family metalloprotease-like protein
MALIGRFLAFALVLPAALFSQQLSHPVGVSRDDAFSAARAGSSAGDTLRILAVMVQFAADTDPYSSGTGLFDLSAASDSILDAPPRNAAYFRDHLTFAQNYFSRVSRRKQVVTWHLIDSVITLPSTMSNYSPGASDQPTAVARLARDTWHRVDSLGMVPDFSRYNCFILFHAGVGRDVNLVSIVGYDPTPHDIPSLYIGPAAFQSLLGGGIPVNSGGYTITNSIVIPETESRILPGISGDYLLELGINGMLCASIGNRLGLPDLYDTRTGNSGIGRFGLMDGQAIFSFNGAFPPAPSAWEKAWLGWLTPIMVPAGTTSLTLPAVELADTVYRIPISASEYFLLENRNRAPGNAGVSVTSTFNGNSRVQVFPRDIETFYAYDVSALAGTVTDVDDPDWSLPGGTTDAGELFDGGILIWHIDESVIAGHLTDNQVNADPGHRGVNLVEADGSQDIGQQYDQFSAASGSEQGTALDFWFSGNASPVNTNEFSATTRPNTNSALGAPTHIAVRNFSARGVRMSVTVERGDATAAPVKGYPRSTGHAPGMQALTVFDHVGGEGQGFSVAAGAAQTGPTRYSGGTLSLLPPDSTGSVRPFRLDGVMATAQPAADFSGAVAFDVNRDGVNELATAVSGSNAAPVVRIFDATTAGADSLSVERFSRAIGTGEVRHLCAGDSLLAMATSTGRVYFIGRGGTSVDSITLGSAAKGISSCSGVNRFLLVNGDSLTLTARNADGSAAAAPVMRSFGHMLTGAAATGSFGHNAADARVMVCVSTADGWLYLLDEALSTVAGFPVRLDDVALTPPVLADVDGDGVRDCIAAGGSKIYAVNITGSLLDNFPVNLREADSLLAPVAGDINGDGRVDIAAISVNGLVAATDRTGRELSGFPIPVTPGSAQSLGIVRGTEGVFLACASSAGAVTLWRTGALPPNAAALYPWPQSGADAGRTGRVFSQPAGAVLSSEFLPHDRTYNWPNPVTDGVTHIRFYVRDDASVNIKIFDLAGDKVTEFSAQGRGGLDNEVIWNVGNVQSGVYLARIEATGSGASGVAIIKVAVVK